MRSHTRRWLSSDCTGAHVRRCSRDVDVSLQGFMLQSGSRLSPRCWCLFLCPYVSKLAFSSVTPPVLAWFPWAVALLTFSVVTHVPVLAWFPWAAPLLTFSVATHVLHGLTFPSPAGEHKVHKYGGLTLLSSRGASPPNGCWSCLGISVFPSAVEMHTKGWGRREGRIQKTWDEAAVRGEWRVCRRGSGKGVAVGGHTTGRGGGPPSWECVLCSSRFVTRLQTWEVRCLVLSRNQLWK